MSLTKYGKNQDFKAEFYGVYLGDDQMYLINDGYCFDRAQYLETLQ